MGSKLQLIRSDPERQDAVLNLATMELTSPPGDGEVIYDGPCWVFDGGEAEDWGGGRDDDERPAHLLHVPWDAPVPRSGDRVKITSCPDPSVVDSLVEGGYLLRVRKVNRSEYLVTRMFTVDRVGGPAPSTA